MNSSQEKLIRGFSVAIFFVVCAFGLGVFVGSTIKPTGSAVSAGGVYDADYLQTVYSQIKDNYLGELPSSEDFTYGLAKGLVDALGDQYSAFMTPTESEQFASAGGSAFEGIGVYLGYDGQYTYVITPIDGFPAQKAGMLQGDVIIEVDGEDVAGQRPEMVATKIKGEAGSTVSIRVYREDSSSLEQFDIKREEVKIANMSYEQLDSGIVLIDIVQFMEAADDINQLSEPVLEFAKNWDNLVDEVAALNPTAVIVDVRNNPGGFVASVRYVAEEFLHTGDVIMREQQKDESGDVFTDGRVGKLEDVPVVVLVNEASASAAEIFAVALQENGRAQVIGQPTVGKGVEQTLVPLPDNALLRLTFQRWLTPKGRQITPEQPVTPDQLVEITADDYAAGNDVQLNAAQSLLATN